MFVYLEITSRNPLTHLVKRHLIMLNKFTDRQC